MRPAGLASKNQTIFSAADILFSEAEDSYASCMVLAALIAVAVQRLARAFARPLDATC